MALSNGKGVTITSISCYYHPDAQLLEDYHAGDMVCSMCGLVVGERTIDMGSEWRSFGDDSGSKDMSRVGGCDDAMMDGNNLGAYIQGLHGQGSFGKLNVSKEESKHKAITADIRDVARKLNISKTVSDRAFTLYNRMQKIKIKIPNKEAMVAACLYIECRKEQEPRTTKEFKGVTSASLKLIHKAINYVQKEIKQVDMCDLEKFMPRYCAYLQLPMSTQKIATHIAETSKHLTALGGCRSMTIIAASIYMAVSVTNSDKPIEMIAEVTRTTSSTIKQCYKLMRPHSEKLLPENYK